MSLLITLWENFFRSCLFSSLSVHVENTVCVHVCACVWLQHITLSCLIILVCVASVESAAAHEALNRMRSWGKSSQTSPPFVSRASRAVDSPWEGGGDTTCALDPITSFITGTHFHTNGFHHRGSPLALKRRAYKRQRGEWEALLLQ